MKLPWRRWRRSGVRRRRRTPEGIRITKVGLWYVLFAVLVAIAATNTGNNALYLVVAVMLSGLVVSGITSRHNVDGLEIDVRVTEEVFANQPFHLAFTLRNRSRWFPHWLLLISASRWFVASGSSTRGGAGGAPRLIPFLPRRGESRGRLELLIPRRGLHHIRAIHVSSLFPFGFFRKGARYHVDEDLLVLPELYAAAPSEVDETGRFGDEPMPRAGWGHGLHALRRFRQGDDPRSIHWKQSARTGALIYMERESEESRRLSILFDNGVGPVDDEDERERFERLVSEAATTAVDFLDRGFEVELVTRGRRLPFGTGRRHRYAVLESLALIEAADRMAGRLMSSDPGAPQIRLGMGREAWPEVPERGAGRSSEPQGPGVREGAP